ncbi:phage holin family protein [Robiginitalea sp. SC105]|uniref:phage holin family protein n=1 Tax=Robiginitalea sp. SC105 TaxID=2762332 RepID=UPI00163A3C17|nr:phage holin family protein [Robiginitalea sp. SC105]MBC2839565.1 phage holin family protein [Robiginitalea sp. SC105]
MNVPAPKEALQNAAREARQYLDSSRETIRLQAFRLSMRLVTSLVKSLLVGVFALLAMLFLSVGTALALGVWMGSMIWGFLLVGAGYLVVFGLAYRFRDRLDAPVLRNYSDLYSDL